MPRPTSKDELILAANSQFDALWRLVDALPETGEFPFEDRDRNVRDVLAHLHEWHRMMIGWHRIGTLEGGSPAVPGEGYTWKTLPALNRTIWAKYQDTSLDEAKALLRGSHAEIMRLIDGHTNAELFDRGVYKWTKSTTLGAYFISSTSSHYDWAMKKLKRYKKAAGL